MAAQNREAEWPRMVRKKTNMVPEGTIVNIRGASWKKGGIYLLGSVVNTSRQQSNVKSVNEVDAQDMPDGVLDIN